MPKKRKINGPKRGRIIEKHTRIVLFGTKNYKPGDTIEVVERKPRMVNESDRSPNVGIEPKVRHGTKTPSWSTRNGH